jgi:glycosyltransferase involved in cell wall biosynthesis
MSGATEPNDDLNPMILHVRTVSGFGGGPEKTILNSPRCYREFGYQAKCVYLHPPGDPGIEALQSRAAAAACDLIPLADRGPLDLRLVGKLISLCRQWKVKIWHSHDYKTNALGLLVRRFHRMVLVSTVHGWVEHTSRTPLYYRIDKLCLPWFDQVVCVSDDLYEECRKLGVRSDRCTLVRNGIDTEVYRRTMGRNQAKTLLSAPPQGHLIGAVGRLSPEKGFDKLIDAAVELRRGGLPVHLWIAGEGKARPQLEAQIARLKCGEFVRLLGQIGDPTLLYQALDAFVLSSEREGLPNVVLEAMACGAPVIATRIAGVPALVRDGRDGLLIEPGDSGAIAGAVRTLLTEQDVAQQLANSARRQVEDNFSFRQRTRQVCEVHDRARSSTSRSRSDAAARRRVLPWSDAGRRRSSAALKVARGHARYPQ